MTTTTLEINFILAPWKAFPCPSETPATTSLRPICCVQEVQVGYNGSMVHGSRGSFSAPFSPLRVLVALSWSWPSHSCSSNFNTMILWSFSFFIFYLLLTHKWSNDHFSQSNNGSLFHKPSCEFFVTAVYISYDCESIALHLLHLVHFALSQTSNKMVNLKFSAQQLFTLPTLLARQLVILEF